MAKAKPLIMVVEDEVPYANKIAETINKTEKYSTVTAYSAKEAFLQLKKNSRLFGFLNNKIRLILLDIKMPEMDGLQFLEKMRKEHAGENIGVIMVTAYEDEEKWNKATDNFVVGYITKPFAPETLIAALDRYFSSEQAYIDMTLDTFKRHMEKREDLKGQK